MKRRLSLLSISLLFLLLLSGCGSELVEINAPDAIEPLETFEVSTAHVYNDDADEFPTNGEGIFLTFSLLMPIDWTPSLGGTYDGERNGTAFTTAAVLLPQPPTSTVVQELIDDGADADIITLFTLLDCELSPPTIPAGYQLAWYQVDLDLPIGPVVSGDTGLLTVNLTSGPPPAGVSDITFQHASHAINPNDANESFCTFYSDPTSTGGDVGDILADDISAVIMQLDSAALQVPTLAGSMLALFAALMVLTGFVVGRRRLNTH